MKHLLPIFALMLSLPLLLSCGSDDGQEVQKTEGSSDSIAILASKIASCSRIYTAEVHMHKVIVADDPMKIGGSIFGTDFKLDIPLGEKKIAIPMNADAKACIDLSGFSKENVKMDGNDIIIELPKPTIELTSTDIDHDGVKTNISIFRSNFSDKEMETFTKKGRDEIIKSVPKSGLIEKAQSGAAAVIVPMLQQLGYKDKNIRVVFDNSVTSDPINFIKKNLTVK